VRVIWRKTLITVNGISQTSCQVEQYECEYYTVIGPLVFWPTNEGRVHCRPAELEATGWVPVDRSSLLNSNTTCTHAQTRQRASHTSTALGPPQISNDQFNVNNETHDEVDVRSIQSEVDSCQRFVRRLIKSMPKRTWSVGEALGF
jgi:hypothetical protein